MNTDSEIERYMVCSECLLNQDILAGHENRYFKNIIILSTQFYQMTVSILFVTQSAEGEIVNL
jgi:hypothetical protein